MLGAGEASLVAAHYLARGGARVLALGHPPADRDAGWVPGSVVRDLKLEKHGFKISAADPWLSAPTSGGRLDLWRDPARTAASIAAFSARDAARWPAFCTRMARLARLLEKLYLSPPPDPLARRAGDIAKLASLALRARLLGREGMEDLLRLLPMSAADFLDDWFESNALKGLLGSLAVENLHQGPRAGGTAFALLHRHAGCEPGVFMHARSNLLEVLTRLPGIELRDTSAAGIAVREGRAVGVVLPDGEEIAAAAVVSGADPISTLLEWTDPGWLDPELVRAVRHIRSRGVAARVSLMLDRDPGFRALAIAPSLDYLERAHDDAKYARISESPFVQAHAEAVSEDRYLVTLRVQYAPYTIAAGWDRERCESLADAAVGMLASAVPGIESSITERQVLSPVDLQQRNGWPQGQPTQAELTLDQVLWMRPVPELARYRTPVKGLYLCGAAVHPGIGAVSGRNAARQVLRDFGRFR